MNPKLFAELFKHMELFMEEAGDDDDWPTVWWPENVALKMARAAEQVFDSTVDASKYAEEQFKEDN